jgi:CheY-like chemotaxis protein
MPTILYIGDSPTNRRLVERIAGKEGLEIARRQPSDSILLDLKLPDLQGDQIPTSRATRYCGSSLAIPGRAASPW